MKTGIGVIQFKKKTKCELDSPMKGFIAAST